MKIILLILVSLIAAAFIFHTILNPGQPAAPARSENYLGQADINVSSTADGNAGPVNKTPSGFKGPTGSPHIIGPSGPPPPY